MNDPSTAANTPTQFPLSWLLYTALLFVRIFVGPFLPGYVHPDEFFQGGQELWFGCPPTIPWEFEPDNALRSVVPPTVLTWLPLQLYSFLLGRPMDHLSGREVLIVPRFACSILSVLAVDWSVWSIATSSKSKTLFSKRGVPTQVLVLASAWPTIVLMNRPFSNALETYFVALLLCHVLVNNNNNHHHEDDKTKITIVKCCIVGFLCALGLFTRFTFVFFAFPAGLVFLNQLYQIHGIRGSLAKVLVVGLGFLVVSAGIVYLDTSFYLSRTQHIENEPSTMELVLTPWNALSYNSKVSNLKDHGLHPRWTHGLVNMFLLYGPLTLVGYFSVLGAATQKEMNTVTTVSRWTLVFGLSLLSLAPHQEPRFLLPLIVPLVLLGGDTLFSKRVFSVIWIVFNVILLLLFGFLHQAGVVQGLLAVGSTMMITNGQPLSMIFFHTYMPPTFLSRMNINERAITCDANAEGVCVPGDDDHDIVCRNIRMIDLNGSSLVTLRNTLDAELFCSKESDQPMEAGRYVHVTMPPLVGTLDEEHGGLWFFSVNDCSIPGYNCKVLWGYVPHLTTEDPPLFDGSLLKAYQGMKLNIYEVSCRQ